jgi:hypothetical protein
VYKWWELLYDPDVTCGPGISRLSGSIGLSNRQAFSGRTRSQGRVRIERTVASFPFKEVRPRILSSTHA